MFVKRVDEAAARTIVETLKTSSSAFSAVQLRVLEGAVARVPSGATAYAHRSSPIMVNIMALHTPEDRAKQEAWTAAFAEALQQDEPGAYVNFLGADGPERVWAAYPGKTFERLQAAKAKYDPGNLFRLNQNIAPAR
jgi:hypothetical protein